MLKEKDVRTIIFGMYSVETKIEIMTAVQVGKALNPIWQGISFSARSKEFGRMDVRFQEAASLAEN